MARAIGFGTATLVNVDTSDDLAFDWYLFAHQESLARYVAHLGQHLLDYMFD